MNWAAVSIAIALTSALAAVIGLLWSAGEARRATRHQVFTEYTRRYQEIMLRIPTTIFTVDFDFDQLGQEQSEATLRAMRAYFDMCWEELHLRQEKKLDTRVWEYWRDGILDLAKYPAFGQAWNRISRGRYYDRPFSAFIEDVKLGRVRTK